jgi:hypothetical protein
MSQRSVRAWWRTIRLGLPTVLGLKPRGFFVPCRYAGAVPPPGQRPVSAAVEARLRERAGCFARVVRCLERYRPALLSIAADAPPPAPRWRQTWFPGLDGAVAYAIVRRLRPRRLIEVGSGHSTRFFARAAADGGGTTHIVAIDPAPRAALSGLAVDIVPRTVQAAGLAAFAALGAGDVLSIDSSHLLMPGSDVDLLLNHVLPALPPGVIVHFHDVFLPDDYPPRWSWRNYNEQLGIAALLSDRRWRIVWSSHYVRSRWPDLLGGTVVADLPCPEDAVESSLWLWKARH